MMSDLTTHETKAARLMVLYRLRAEGQLADLSDSELAEAFDLRRETIWRDRQALAQADALYQRIIAAAPWGDSYDVAEAAAQLGCGEQTVRYMVHDGIMRAAKLDNGRWRIPKTEIERLRRP